MADDLKQTGKADDQRVNIEQDHELSFRDVRRHLSR